MSNNKRKNCFSRGISGMSHREVPSAPRGTGQPQPGQTQTVFPFVRKRWTPVNGRSTMFSWPSSLKYFLGGKRELEASRNALCLSSIHPPPCHESKRVWEEEEGSGMELSPGAVPTRGLSCWGACPAMDTLRARDTAHGPSCRPDPSRVPHP